MVEQQSLGSNPITRCHKWKACAKRLVCRWIDCLRASRAVTRADDVGADDAIAFKIEYTVCPEQLRPPIPRSRGTRQCVADQDRVVALLIQMAIDRVMQPDRLQRSARFER